MPFKFNPFSGNFDQTGSGGGGASYIDGEVATYNDLPLDGTAALDSAWLVRSASGVWPVSRKQAGIYIRTATGGVSRDADFTYAGTMPDVFSDAVLTIYDEASTTRTGQFNLGSVTAGQNRVLTWPDANGTIARTEDFAAPPAIGSTTRNTGAFTTLSANNGTLTANAPVLDLAQTWNNAAVTFTGLRVNVTNTASGSSSLLADFQVGGTSQFAVSRAGTVTMQGNLITSATTVIQVGNSPRITLDGTDGTFLALHANHEIRWATGRSDQAAANPSLILVRDGANDTLAQRRTTNPQTFRLYNTFTDASNYERAKIAWSSNVLQIGTEKGGTGSARALEFQTDGTTRLALSTGGLVQFAGTTSSFPALKRSSTTLQVRLADDSAFAPLISSQIGIGVASPERPLHIQTSDAMVRIDRVGSAGPALLMVRMATLGSVTSSWLMGPATGFASVANDDFSIIDFGTTTSGTGGTQRLTIAKSDGQLTVNGNLNLSTKNLVTDTTTGTRIGTATNQLLGFFNATPVTQRAAIADATDAASTQARLNDLLAAMRSLGLIAT